MQKKNAAKLPDFEFPPAKGSAGAMFEARICVIGAKPGGGLGARRMTLRHYFPDEQIARFLRSFENGGPDATMFGYETDDNARHIAKTPLDMRMSSGVPTKIIYHLDVPNWVFADEASAFTLRKRDPDGQFHGLRPIGWGDEGIKTIRVQNLNSVAHAFEINLNVKVEQFAGRRKLSTLLKLHPLVLNRL